MAHPNLVGGSGGRVGPFAVSGNVAVGAGALLAVGLIALRLLDASVSELLVFLFVAPIALCAVRFGFRGGIASAAAGTGIAFVWLVHGQGVTDGLPAFGVQAAVFFLVGGLVGTVISERRRFEVAVTAHNEMSLELISTASFDGYFTRLNPAWTDVLGWELSELKARPFSDFVHPDDATTTDPVAVRKTDAGLPVFNFQNRYRCRDGSYRWLEWTSRSDKGARRVYSVARDVTKRKEGEETLASFQEALEQAVHQRTMELEQRTNELDESRRETLQRLALAAEYRDDETFAHTERVGRMATDLALQLDVSAENVALLRFAAPLHDVGKLALSDTIVLKRGKLTDAEMQEVRKHPEDGARILANSNSDVLQLAEQIALGHHEWWDGSGYPFGLAGEEIPQCARIVAVADVYDALTHARPYKQAWPIEQAIDEIRSLSGRQFDPDVVDALLELDHPRLVALDQTEPAIARTAANGGSPPEPASRLLESVRRSVRTAIVSSGHPLSTPAETPPSVE